jgi:hypothetical protein
MALLNTVGLQDLLEYRFDAECHSPALLAAERQIQALRTRPLSSVANVSDGNHASIADQFTASGVRYLKGAEASSFFIDDEDPTFIPLKVYEALSRAQVEQGDVLISVIGTVGPVALVSDKYEKLSCSCKLAILRPQLHSAACLAVFFTTSVGQKLIERRTRGSVQQGMILPDLRKFPIPDFSEAVVSEVDELVAKASTAAKTSVRLYPEAELELLDRMGWKQLIRKPTQTTFSSSLSEVSGSERADAEFFHPFAKKFRSNIAKEGAILGSMVSRFRKGTQPETYDPDGEVIVVKSKNVRGRGIHFDSCERTSIAAWSDADARLAEGDLIINSTGRGTLGRVEAVGSLPGQVVGSVDLILCQVDSKTVLPVYLALFLNSPAGIAQSERFQTGSSGQLHLYPEHASQFMIFLPRGADGKPDLLWQRRLCDKVETAAKARAESEALLARARDTVELALIPRNRGTASRQ